MAFELVPLDNAEFAVIVGCAEPGSEFDAAEFNGTEMGTGRFDGAVPLNPPVEADAIGFAKEFEGPEDVGPVVG